MAFLNHEFNHFNSLAKSTVTSNSGDNFQIKKFKSQLGIAESNDFELNIYSALDYLSYSKEAKILTA